MDDQPGTGAKTPPTGSGVATDATGARPRRSGPSAPRRVRGDLGRAEFVVLGTVALLLGAAFLWALVLNDRSPEPEVVADPGADVAAATAPVATTVPQPVTAPPPRRYRVVGGVNLREGPANNTRLLSRLEDGQRVVVTCKAAGQAVTSPEGSTTLWLRLDLGQYGIGYASALYFDVGDDLENPRRIADCAATTTAR
jgi:hypothetical protein